MNYKSGQAMLMTVIAVGGLLLSAATIAGLLMLFQLRQVSESQESAKAFFAADSGIECALYEQVWRRADICGSPTNGSRIKILSGGAEVLITCRDGSGAAISCDMADAQDAVARGAFSRARRAILLTFASANFSFR